MAAPLPVRVCALILLVLLSCTGESSPEAQPYEVQEVVIPVDSFYSYSFIPFTGASSVLLSGEKNGYHAIAFIDFDLDTIHYDSLLLEFKFAEPVNGSLFLKKLEGEWHDTSLSWSDTALMGEVYREVSLSGEDSVKIVVDSSLFEYGFAVLSNTFLRIEERSLLAFHGDDKETFHPSQDVYLIDLEGREDTLSGLVLGKGVPFRVYIHKPEIPPFKAMLHAGLVVITPDSVSIPVEIWGDERYHTGKIEEGESEINVYHAIKDSLEGFTIRVQNELDDAWKEEIEVDSMFLYLIYIPEEER